MCTQTSIVFLTQQVSTVATSHPAPTCSPGWPVLHTVPWPTILQGKIHSPAAPVSQAQACCVWCVLCAYPKKCLCCSLCHMLPCQKLLLYASCTCKHSACCKAANSEVSESVGHLKLLAVHALSSATAPCQLAIMHCYAMTPKSRVCAPDSLFLGHSTPNCCLTPKSGCPCDPHHRYHCLPAYSA